MVDKKRLYLSVVIPCYNEERNLRLGALQNVAYYLNKQNFTWEAIVVDDGSSDESIILLEEFIKDHKNFFLIKKNHQGKAAAVTTGVLKSRGEIILFADLDQATPISELSKFLPFLRKNYDVILGSRNTKRKGAPFLRLAMARGFMILRNLILNLDINDTQCGFKAFNKRTAFDIFPRLEVFNMKRQASGSTVSAGFDVELIYIAKILKYRIKEIPVEWHYQETRHVNIFKDSIDSIFDLLKVRINSIKGVYQSSKINKHQTINK